MNTMFESGQFFVRIQHKSGRLKITIWNNRGDKIFSDILGPDPAVQFWNAVENLTDSAVAAEIRAKANAART
ncbi:hypothetical protein [Candidatus Darwinibacter acetoxidans]|jgi:hypothetical protein